MKRRCDEVFGLALLALDMMNGGGWRRGGWGGGGRQHEHLKSQLTAGERRTILKFGCSSVIGCWRMR